MRSNKADALDLARYIVNCIEAINSAYDENADTRAGDAFIENVGTLTQ